MANGNCFTTGSTTSGTYLNSAGSNGDILVIRDSHNYGLGLAYETYCDPAQIKFYEKENNMRGLFIVYIVYSDGADDEIWSSGPIVAKNADSAKMKAVKKFNLPEGKELDDFDILVYGLGNVRAKKEVSEVRVIK